MTLVAVVVFVGTAFCTPVAGYWRTNRSVLHDTAYCLEKNEKMIGIISPVGFGATDWATIFVHPVLLMLVTPNLTLRFNVFDGPVGVAIQLSYIETFLDTSGGNFPGTTAAGMRVSIPLKEFMIITTGVEYRLDISPIKHNISMMLGLNFRIDKSNLIGLNANFVYNFSDRRFEVPQGTLMYSYGWERMRLGIGVAFGEFTFDLGDSTPTWPAYPVVDVWWRWF